MAKQIKSKYFIWFILLSGISSLIAAFGHLEILDISLQNNLLMGSRVINMLAIYSFATGALIHFEYYENSWLRILNVSMIVIALGWLTWSKAFAPVMLYGVVGMIFIGLMSFVLNFGKQVKPHTYITLGVGLIGISALIFALFKHCTTFVVTDISHILIATSLFVMALGFKKLTTHEINS